VQQADLLPSMLAMAGLPPVPGLDGGLDGGEKQAPVVTEWYPRPYAAGAEAEPRWLPVRRVGIYEGDYKFVIEGKNREQLFDLRQSPYESTDVIEREPERASELREELTTLLNQSAQQGGNNARPDRDMEEQLRALGYIH
jgi:arylsulfatase A-like enzyme